MTSSAKRVAKTTRNPLGLRFASLCLFILFIFTCMQGTANCSNENVAAMALYQGPDREQVLIEGAKKEGRFVFYNTHTWLATVAEEFEKKFPFIEVSVWRSNGEKLFKRVTEEKAAGRHSVDVIESVYSIMEMLKRKKILLEYYTPESKFYDAAVKSKGKKGLYYLADREVYLGLGFNTKQIPLHEAPKDYKDLVDSRWKGKMALAATTTGILWVGNIINVMGDGYFQQIKQQNMMLQILSGAAIANLVVSGEVPLSPTIYNTSAQRAKSKGAPIEWHPLEPVLALLGYSGIANSAPHPHAALLFLDYLHSIEGQKVVMQGGLSSPRKDIGSLEQRFKKTYMEAIYPNFDEYQQQYNQWERLLKELM